jgi:hypothetical protein
MQAVKQKFELEAFWKFHGFVVFCHIFIQFLMKLANLLESILIFLPSGNINLILYFWKLSLKINSMLSLFRIGLYFQKYCLYHFFQNLIYILYFIYNELMIKIQLNVLCTKYVVLKKKANHLWCVPINKL